MIAVGIWACCERSERRLRHACCDETGESNVGEKDGSEDKPERPPEFQTEPVRREDLREKAGKFSKRDEPDPRDNRRRRG